MQNIPVDLVISAVFLVPVNDFFYQPYCNSLKPSLGDYSSLHGYYGDRSEGSHPRISSILFTGLSGMVKEIKA